jgi:adenylate cyclase class 2
VRRDDGRCLLTLKGPAQPGIVKIREEHETEVGDAAVLLAVLRAAGLHACFRYQKYRQEFAAPDVVVAIDETPIGTFVEIEGEEPGILAMAAALGRQPGDFILDSYRLLFEAHQRELQLTGADMVFDEVPSERSESRG